MHRHWSWCDWVRDTRCEERFVLLDEHDEPGFIWCAASSRLLRLPGGPFYRPDRLEVAPNRVRSGVGTLGMAALALRALERSANGVVLKATRAAAPFYVRLGGTPGDVAGWSHSPDLVEFTFTRPVLQELAELLDACRQEEEPVRSDG
ncbi:MAG: GNAT family N-acetyltransferase [Myxococcales bacterium]|nr:GNAT family N-acetyltransferase [Myxococcales bacterium]